VLPVVKVATIPLVRSGEKISLLLKLLKREKQNRLSKSQKKRKKKSLHPKKDFKEKLRVLWESLALGKNQLIKMMTLTKMPMMEISLILPNLHRRSLILLLSPQLLKSKRKRKNQKKNLKMEVKKVKSLKLLSKNSQLRQEVSHNQIMSLMGK
jgi:hypothetical protein